MPDEREITEATALVVERGAAMKTALEERENAKSVLTQKHEAANQATREYAHAKAALDVLFSTKRVQPARMPTIVPLEELGIG